MRHPATLVLALAALAATACKQESAPARAAASASPATASAGSGAAVTWKRTLLTFDENANDRLDDDERQPAKGMSYGYTLLTLKSDGSCDLEKGDKKLSGTCTFGDRKGHRALSLAPSSDLADSYAVLSETDKELVLKDGVGNKGTIYVFARE